jgi:ribonucleotide reductase beta subunit family protein with ferritin-like domain
LIQLGLKGNFNVKKMPASMEWLTGITMGARDTNFFERRVTDYVQKGMTGELDWSVVI